MTGFLTVAAFFAGLAATMAALVWLARRVRRRGIGGGLMGPIDEMWHPSAHRFRLEIETHEQRMMPMSPAEDRDRRRGAAR